MSQHKQSIEKLKETDPEFYKFLEENDQELLQFEDSDYTSDEEGPVHELPEELEVSTQIPVSDDAQHYQKCSECY